VTTAFILASSDHGPLIVNRLDYNHNFNGDFYGVGAQIMEGGCYDPREVEVLKNLLLCRREHFGDGVVAIDAGANIGVHSVEWSRLMRGWGSVISIEAQERIFYALAGNLALHNAFNARAIHAAISDSVGELSFPEPDYTQSGSFGSFELRPRVGAEFIGQPVDYAKPTITVRQLSLDSLELPRVDLIKMDIEGMEAEGLDGAAQTIERCKPILFVETIKSDKKAIKAALEGAGYVVLPHGMNVMALHKDDPTLQNIGTRQEAA
jgi:FkbM family methyltransferase